MNKFKSLVLSTIISLIFIQKIEAQQINVESSNPQINIPLLIDSLLKEGYENKMFPGIALALSQPDTIQFLQYGLANLETGSRVTKHIKFQLGSIGKLLTAMAVMQQIEKGALDLTADIREYIGSKGQDIFSQEEPITLHCLLTHSCGFNDVNIGYMARDEKSVLSLENFIYDYFPGTFQSPEKEIIYSNYSYALAGFIVESVSGRSFKGYIDQFIFQPLGMKNSTLNFPYNYDIRTDFANTYRSANKSYSAIKVFPRHGTPAGSLISTTQDMGLFAKALLKKNNGILSQKSWDMLFNLKFTNHPLLNGYSYGFEQQNINGHAAWAKGGMIPGQLSSILVVPGHFAIFYAINTDNDEFGELFYKALFDKCFPNSSRNKPKIDISTADYIGEYRDKRYNRKTEENIISLFRGQFNVYENKTKDSLVVYHNGEWHSYLPMGNHVFQNEALPYEYLTFKANNQGDIESMYRNMNIGGLSVPTSYEKTYWYNSPHLINEYYGLLPLFILTGLLFILASIIVRVVRIWRDDYYDQFLLPPSFHLFFGLTTLLHTFHLYFVPIQLITDSYEFLKGYPDSFRIFSILGYLLIPLTILLAFQVWGILKKRIGTLFTRIYLLTMEFSIVIYLLYLAYWNFL